ncbi:hypothetical protein LguiB_010608 [Lonicera macranthoides]
MVPVDISEVLKGKSATGKKAVKELLEILEKRALKRGASGGIGGKRGRKREKSFGESNIRG